MLSDVISVIDRTDNGGAKNQQEYNSQKRKYDIEKYCVKEVMGKLKQYLIAKEANLIRYNK